MRPSKSNFDAMKKEAVFQWVKETYGIEPDYPWIDDDSAVLRHKDNRKWFGLVMHIASDKLGLRSTKSVDVLNVKCDPLLIPALHQERGIFPAYHMNKTNWISILLDGSVKAADVKALMDMSYELTKKKVKNRGNE